MTQLEVARALGAQEAGLAVAITTRRDGTPRASVVNAGVVPAEIVAGPAVGFVSKGDARKLGDLRARPAATVVFRSGWDWIALEGEAHLIGPDDNAAGLDHAEILGVVRAVYAAAVGGTPEDWSGLDDAFVRERHTAVLIRVARIYPSDDATAEPAPDRT